MKFTNFPPRWNRMIMNYNGFLREGGWCPFGGMEMDGQWEERSKKEAIKKKTAVGPCRRRSRSKAISGLNSLLQGWVWNISPLYPSFPRTAFPTPWRFFCVMKNIPFDCPLLLLLLLRFRKIPSVLEVKRRRSGVSSKALFQSSFYWLAAFFPHFLPACSLSCRSVVCHFAQRRYKPALLPFLSALRSSLSFALHFPLPVPEPSYPRVTHYRPHRITLNKKKGFGITAFLLFAFLQRRRLADLSPVLV